MQFEIKVSARLLLLNGLAVEKFVGQAARLRSLPTMGEIDQCERLTAGLQKVYATDTDEIRGPRGR